MLLVSVYLFSFTFQYSIRKAVFTAISMGVIIHLGFDLLQSNLCKVGYLWFFPLSLEKPQILSLYHEDNSIFVMPAVMLWYCIAEWIFKGLKKIHSG